LWPAESARSSTLTPVGNVVQITPQIAGTVLAINADDTDYVQAGQALKVENGFKESTRLNLRLVKVF